MRNCKKFDLPPDRSMIAVNVHSGPTFAKLVWAISGGCPTGQTGVIFQRSTISFNQITDGTAFTYLYGEKNLRADEYETGIAGNDDQSMYNGWDRDNARSAAVRITAAGLVGGDPPVPDTPGSSQDGFTGGNYDWRFGGPRTGGWMAVFCDGSVHFLSYDMEPLIHPKLGNRRDGLVIDTSQVF